LIGELEPLRKDPFTIHISFNGFSVKAVAQRVERVLELVRVPRTY
jgi:hypothetical protein